MSVSCRQLRNVQFALSSRSFVLMTHVSCSRARRVVCCTLSSPLLVLRTYAYSYGVSSRVLVYSSTRASVRVHVRSVLVSAGERDEVRVRVRAQLEQGVELPRAPAVVVRASRPPGLDRRAPSITSSLALPLLTHFTSFHSTHSTTIAHRSSSSSSTRTSFTCPHLR